jgi:hypothetical protein
MQSVRHAQLKTARALEHLEALGTELKIFYDAKPCFITWSDDADSGRHVVRVQRKDVSDRTAILAGDFVHNLRCALDHAIFSLASYARRHPRGPLADFLRPGTTRRSGCKPKASRLTRWRSGEIVLAESGIVHS